MLSEDPNSSDVTGQASYPAQQPRARRSTLLLLVARIIGERHDTLCRLSNISAGGMRADGPANVFRVGERVAVEIRNVHQLSGEGRWVRGGAFGIRFDQELVVPDFLSAVAAARSGQDSEYVRPPRLPTCCQVEVRAAGRIHRPLMFDISQAGARLVFDGPILDPALLLTIAIPGLPIRQAAVRWSEDTHYGLGFLEPFGLIQLSEWLIGRERFRAAPPVE